MSRGGLTLDIGELRERWMKLYLNIMVIKSTDDEKSRILRTFKDKIVEFNEAFIRFFDEMEGVEG